MEGSPASNNYQPGFMVDLMAKDLGLALDVAATAGIDNRMGKLAQALYAEHQAADNGARDFSSVLEHYRDTKS
jgi:3-hydroxyisobutyrate dehydrogenase